LGARRFKDLMSRLAQRGKTILLSSHLLAEVEDVCHRIVILYGGRVQAAGPIPELLAERTRHRVNLPALSPEQLKEVRATLRSMLGTEPSIEHPRMDLEQFFLQVVAQARSVAHDPASGAEEGGGIAPYLSGNAATFPRERARALVEGTGTAPAKPLAGADSINPASAGGPDPSGGKEPPDRPLGADRLPPGE
jgi:hypothetical protein